MVVPFPSEPYASLDVSVNANLLAKDSPLTVESRVNRAVRRAAREPRAETCVRLLAAIPPHSWDFLEDSPSKFLRGWPQFLVTKLPSALSPGLCGAFLPRFRELPDRRSLAWPPAHCLADRFQFHR